MPPSESQIYARQLLPKGHGYPLWIPEPPDTHPDEYKMQGVEIGDVGIITGDGAFKFIFNICRSSDDPINFLGVPVGFEQVTLASTDLCSHLQRHSCGSHIASSCVSKKNVRIDLSSSGNPMIPVNASVGMAFTSSSNEGAVLALPTGASQHDLEPVEDFLDYAMRHAVRWYEFVNVTLRRRVYNGSLYLVTGCDKTASWGVASFSNASGSGEIFLQYKAMQAGGSASCEWQWETHSPATVRNGPKFVGDGQNQPQNQCVFLRGYKVAVRESFSFFKKPVKLSSIVDSKPQDILAQGSSIPFASGSRYSSNRFSENGRANIGGPQDWLDDHWSNEPYHPSNAINDHLLESASVPDAIVAVTHDNEWCSIIDENDTVFPDESEVLRRIRCRFVSSIHSSGGVFFVPAGDPQSDDSSPSPSTTKGESVSGAVSFKPLPSGLELEHSPHYPPRAYLPASIELANLKSNIRQILTTIGGDRSSRPAPGPDVERPDFTLLVREDHSGKVMAGTVEGLIGRLISDSQDFRKKMAYRGTFFISYVGFTTSDTIFKFLAQSLRDAADFDARRRGTILYNVTAVMKDWLASPHVQVEMDVLLQMKNFAHSFGTAPRMVDFADYVTETIRMRDNTPHPLSRKTVPTPNLPSQETSPGSLAKALTILEGRIYDRLLPGDYIVHFMHPSTEGNIADACKIHKAIKNWVQQSILIPENYEVRAGNFEFFAYTAIECHKIHNFASTAAIINALQSPSIKCLCTTLATVKKPRRLNTLFDLEDLIRSRPRYNKALEKSKGKCVPWIDAHLAQLKTIFDKHPQTIEHEGHTMINFKRYQEFSAEIGKFTHSKAPNFVHDPETTSWLVYLEDQLRTIQEDNEIEHYIVRRSQDLEVEEKRLLQQRVLRRMQLDLSRFVHGTDWTRCHPHPCEDVPRSATPDVSETEALRSFGHISSVFSGSTSSASLRSQPPSSDNLVDRMRRWLLKAKEKAPIGTYQQKEKARIGTYKQKEKARIGTYKQKEKARISSQNYAPPPKLRLKLKGENTNLLLSDQKIM